MISTHGLNKKNIQAEKKKEALPTSSVEVGQKEAIKFIDGLETVDAVKKFVPEKEREDVLKSAMAKIREIKALERARGTDNNESSKETTGGRAN